MTNESSQFFADFWPQGLPYAEFLRRNAKPEQYARWEKSLAATTLTPEQTTLLQGFTRDMQIMVLAGAWCGDCSSQCPIFERFAEATPRITVRYFDRDDFPTLAEELEICGGRRVPTVVFLDEEGIPCGRYGDKTLSKYRQLAGQASGAACSTGLPMINDPVAAAVIQDWLNEFERNQLMLRLSSRLRQKHGD